MLSSALAVTLGPEWLGEQGPVVPFAGELSLLVQVSTLALTSSGESRGSACPLPPKAVAAPRAGAGRRGTGCGAPAGALL